MEKEFIPYEQALALKELGFDEPCFCIYNREKVLRFNNLNNPNDRNKGVKLTSNNGRYPAPTFSQAFRWFRGKYNLREQYGVFPHHTIITNYIIDGGNEEEAEIECLKKLIEIVKEKKI